MKRRRTGPTPNQVYFIQRGRTLMGWIDKSTPLRYHIVYETGRGMRSVWRPKSGVSFVQDGRRRRRSVNPCLSPELSQNPELAQALRLSRRFFGMNPRGRRSIAVRWPKAVTQLGICTRLEYASDKFDGKLRVYFHDFKRPPVLLTPGRQSGPGANMLILFGRFHVEDAGITG